MGAPGYLVRSKRRPVDDFAAQEGDVCQPDRERAVAARSDGLGGAIASCDNGAYSAGNSPRGGPWLRDLLSCEAIAQELGK
jgi:hypothetical protein